MCGVGEQMRKKQQRLLKNMDAHKVMLDLLQIPYDKVTGVQPAYTVPVYHCTAALQGRPRPSRGGGPTAAKAARLF